MTTTINIDKINNIVFFNPKIIKENDYKQRKYEKLIDESDNIEVYPKEQDNEKQKQSSFKKFRTELYKDIRSSGKFCDGLQATYVKESLMNCDFILRVESSQTRSKKINGFATLKMYKGSKSLYVDVICTNTDIKGTGSYMVKLLSKICDTISLDSIKLSSATQAVPFYLKTDFECDPLCKMKKEINGGSRTRKNRRNSHNKTLKII
jgi:hypothetical protein